MWAHSNKHMIFQEFISASHGRDLRVFVIDGRVVAAMKRQSKDGSFKANFSRGGSVEPFPVTSEIKHLAIESARALARIHSILLRNVSYVHVDLFYILNYGRIFKNEKKSPSRAAKNSQKLKFPLEARTNPAAAVRALPIIIPGLASIKYVLIINARGALDKFSIGVC